MAVFVKPDTTFWGQIKNKQTHSPEEYFFPAQTFHWISNIFLSQDEHASSGREKKPNIPLKLLETHF